MAVLYFKITLMLNNLLFVHEVRILMDRKRVKLHLVFIFRRSSNSKFYKTTGLNSREKISIEIILSEFGCLLKLIWCMYGQSSLRPIDGKYQFLLY